MKFQKTKIKGVYLIELEKQADKRGFLVRTYDKNNFDKLKINFEIKQSYISDSFKKGTVRGIHYQIPPFAEAKLSKCISGSIYEVVIDLRKNSKTYLKWEGFKIDAGENKMLFMPAMCGHGFLTLADKTVFSNSSDEYYNGKYEKGIRFDDSYFKFDWPIKPTQASEKDLAWPDFKETA